MEKHKGSGTEVEERAEVSVTHIDTALELSHAVDKINAYLEAGQLSADTARTMFRGYGIKLQLARLNLQAQRLRGNTNGDAGPMKLITG